MLKENGSPPQGKWADIAPARAGARLQGAACLDHADLRCRGRCDRPDRGQGRSSRPERLLPKRSSPRYFAGRRRDTAGRHHRLRRLGRFRRRRGWLGVASLLTKRSCTGLAATRRPALSQRRRCAAALRRPRRWSRDWSAAIPPATIRADLPTAARSATATADRPRRPCRRCIWRDGRCRVPRSSDPARCSSRPWRRRRGRPSRSDAPGHARPRARSASCPTAAGTRTSTRNRLRARRSARSPCAVWFCDADADGGQRTEIAPAPSERDGVVDRTAAGIQHDGRAAEIASAREFVEILRAVRGHDADRADPAPAIRLAGDPAEPHRQFAFFEGSAGMRRTAERRHDAGQCDAKGGGAEQRPAAKIKRPHKPQFGSFPQAPDTRQWQWPQFNAK